MHNNHIYVVVQIYPFPIVLGIAMNDNQLQQRKIKFKPKKNWTTKYTTGQASYFSVEGKKPIASVQNLRLASV